MTMTLLPAPTVSAEIIRRALEWPTALVVWLPAISDVEVAPAGLTPAQADSPDIIPLLTHDEVRAYVTAAQGVLSSAATVITNVLAEQVRLGQL